MFILAMIGVGINVLIFVILGGHGHSHFGHSHDHDHDHGHGEGHDHADKSHKVRAATQCWVHLGKSGVLLNLALTGIIVLPAGYGAGTCSCSWS
jgi:hypothetical protein